MSDLDYRIQDGCWNCINRVHEIGPDGSTWLYCLLSAKFSSSTAVNGKPVQEAGICPRWNTSEKEDTQAVRTHDFRI